MQTSAAVRIDYLPSESERTAALFEYLRTMREVAEAQRQVMLRYLGEDARLAVSPHATQDSSRAVRPYVVVGADVAPAARGPVAAETRRPSSAPPSGIRKTSRTTRPPSRSAVAEAIAGLSAFDALVAIVSERTGYPKEMLDPDLDMEADLGIDSIKRIEILGQMRDRLGLSAMSEAARSDALEELAKVKTLRKIAAWLDGRTAAVGALPAA